MPRYIMKIGDRYGEWSTIVDAPVTKLMPLDEFRAYYEREYGRSSMDIFAKRMERVERKGTSSELDNNAASVMSLNRCGPREGCAPVKDVIAYWESQSA